MRFLIVPVLLLLAATTVAIANSPDPNGYTAKYECRAGNSNCDVDVTRLSQATCDQIVRTSDSDWSKITNNQSANVFCIEKGDHRSKGTLTLAFSGHANSRKILRYFASSDAGAHPVHQAPNDRAILRSVEFRNANYWLLHRLTIDGSMGSLTLVRLWYDQSSNHNVFDNLLIQNGAGSNNRLVWFRAGNSYNTLQNSVVRKSVIAAEQDNECVEIDAARNNRLVNNEIYDCQKSVAIKGSKGAAAGTVIENNDLYLTNAYYSDCNGNLNPKGSCAAGKARVSFKTGGTATNPIQLMQNRMWGARYTDRSICCLSTGGGGNITLSTDAIGAAQYVLILNNIVMDAQRGIAQPRDGTGNNSIIGNVFYDIRHHSGIQEPYTLDVRKGNNTEWYLNTLIDVEKWMNLEGVVNNEIRCNVVVNSPGIGAERPSSGTVVDHNAFYNARSVVTGSTGETIDLPDAAASKTEPYCFMRKRLTRPEKFCIPHVKPSTSSPHIHACPASVGTSAGVGTGDQPLF